MASEVSADLTGYSVSFNEYLRLISIKRRAEPDKDMLLEVFRYEKLSIIAISNSIVFLIRLFDPHSTGGIEENQFRKIMSSKQGISEEDVEEMIEGC